MTLVVKNSQSEPFSSEKLRNFLISNTFGLRLPESEITLVVDDIQNGLPLEVDVDKLLQLVAESTAQRILRWPDFSILAGRVEALRIRRCVNLPFSANFAHLHNYVHPKTNQPFPLVSDDAAEFVQNHAEALDAMIVPERDLDLAYFGIRTLAKSYLIHADGKLAETPQYLFLRVAVGIHGHKSQAQNPDAIERTAETYKLMSKRYFVHSSPTLFNAGTPNNYLSSCFLMAMEDDSIDGIYRTLHKAALISKGSGGIGLHTHKIRAAGSLIRSLNGSSTGLVPMLRVFNNTARYVDQGGNKRPGAMAVYLEPWHADVFETLDLRKNHGKEELRARDLFYALWIPDLFMRRVKADLDWPLFSPDEAPGLADVHGGAFEELFTRYERSGVAVRTVKAQKLWSHILQCQIETGMPFMLYKDACNAKLNQQNLGTIQSSNLCCEIVEYSAPGEIAVCNLALLALPSFVQDAHSGCYYDFGLLHKVTKTLVRNLDAVIDVTKYPVDDSRDSNHAHRPIAIGVQGLADTFLRLRLPFDSPEARVLNSQIFETIYHAAVEESCLLATEKGTYSSFNGSPAHKGDLQFDLWGHKPDFFDDWPSLKARVQRDGMRNSLLVAPMPTASTSQILGFNECFEPFTSNIYTRRVLSGEYQVVNSYMVHDLIDLGLWTDSIRNSIVKHNGLIQHIKEIPSEVKHLYKTVWEISQRVIIDMAADRGCFVDQSQSMNIHLQSPTFGKLTSCHFYAWEKGLKTGMYYLRTQAAARAIQFTVDQELDHTNSVNSGISEIPSNSAISRKPYIEQHKFHPEKRPYTPDTLDYDENPKKRNPAHYDIYDNTPLSCSIDTPENCDSCSG